MKYSIIFAAAAAINGANAAVGMWGQCGGIGYSGDTACVAGASCSTLNSWYAQCLSGAGQATTTAAVRTTTTSARPVTTTTTSRTTTTTSARPISTTTTPVRTTPYTPTGVTRTTTPAVVTTTPRATTTAGAGSGPVGAAITLSGNPFSGRQQYPNPYYSSEVYNIAIPSMVAAGKVSLTAAAKAVATVPNFIWFDTISKVPSLDGYLADIRAKNAAGASPQIIGTFVVYDLPDRDCAAKASNGELAIAKDGLNRYKTEYIDALLAIFKKYPDVPVALIIEPDSVANMVTNMGVAKCAGAKATYEEAIIYAVKSLNLPNINMYMDAGHAGWLGWPENLAKAGPYYAGLYKSAGSPKGLRGLATNVANYNAWSITGTCPSYTADFFRITGFCDEKGYINALGPLLRANGFPAQFVVDQGRSGKQPTGQIAWGDWCNIKGTGFGIRPDTPSPDPLLDAFVWIKPGGEGDGTSDQSATRYDSTCGLEAAFKPAPEAGTWFQGYFEQLLTNSNPSFL